MQATTTAGNRRSRARHSAVRWSRVAVIALLAALAVLVHHETPAAAAASVPATAMSGMPGMGHSFAMSMPMDAAGHARTPRAAVPAVGGDDSACSGMAMQHCSTASVDTVKLAPPSARCVLGDDSCGAFGGRDVPGTVRRAPPDLSLLSRLRM